MLSSKAWPNRTGKTCPAGKRALVLFVLLFALVFSYAVIVLDLPSLKKDSDISFTELVLGLLDDNVNSSVNKKFQEAETLSSLFIVNSSLSTVIHSNQQETAGLNQPKKAILRL